VENALETGVPKVAEAPKNELVKAPRVFEAVVSELHFDIEAGLPPLSSRRNREGGHAALPVGILRRVGVATSHPCNINLL
jgi:hypothetical protein